MKKVISGIKNRFAHMSVSTKKTAVISVGAAIVAGAGTAFAEVASGTTAAAMESAFQTVASDTVGIIAIIAPIALGIFAARYLWMWGKNFFSKMSKGG